MILALTFLRFWGWCKTHSQSELQRQKLAKTFLNRESYGEMIRYLVLILIFEKSLATNCTTGGSNDQYRSLYIFNCDSSDNLLYHIFIIWDHFSCELNFTNRVDWHKYPERNEYLAHNKRIEFRLSSTLSEWTRDSKRLWNRLCAKSYLWIGCITFRYYPKIHF